MGMESQPNLTQEMQMEKTTQSTTRFPSSPRQKTDNNGNIGGQDGRVEKSCVADMSREPPHRVLERSREPLNQERSCEPPHQVVERSREPPFPLVERSHEPNHQLVENAHEAPHHVAVRRAVFAKRGLEREKDGSG